MFSLIKFELLSSLRAPKTWQMCLAVIALTFFLFPGEQAGYAVIDINGYRGIYNSAWMGESLALVSSWLLLLIGFYFVVGDITQARQSGLLPLLLSSRLSATQYLVMKFLTRLALLLIVCMSMMITASIQQLFLGESATWNVGSYVLPFVALLLPVAVLVASFSLLFEVVPALSGKGCNAIYFVVWSLLGMVNLAGFSAHSAITAQMEQALGHSSGILSGNISIGISPVESAQQTFLWQGAYYGHTVLSSIAFQVLAGLAILSLAILLANKRYSLLTERTKTPAVKRKERRPVLGSIKSQLATVLLLPLRRFPVLNAELRALIAGISARQQLGFVIVSVMALIAPESTLLKVVLPLAAILPLFMLAQLSMRDINSDTREIVYAACSPAKLNISRWLAAVLLLSILYCGLLVRHIVDLDVVAFLHIMAFICLASSLALLSARLFKSNKPYELFFLTAWFAGPLNKQEAVDFVGISGSSFAMLTTWMVFLASVGLLLALLSYTPLTSHRNWKWLKLSVS